MYSIIFYSILGTEGQTLKRHSTFLTIEWQLCCPSINTNNEKQPHLADIYHNKCSSFHSVELFGGFHNILHEIYTQEHKSKQNNEPNRNRFRLFTSMVTPLLNIFCCLVACDHHLVCWVWFNTWASNSSNLLRVQSD